MAFKLTYLNQETTFQEKIALKTLLPENHSFLCARVNHRIRDLNYEVYFDAAIEFLTIHDQDAVRTYETTLRYLLAMAIHEIDPSYRFRFSYHISRSIFMEFTNPKKIDPLFVSKLEQKLSQLVKQNLAFERMIVPKDEAIRRYEALGYEDKIKILKYRPEKTVHFYRCGNYSNYMFGMMALASGYIQKWKLIYYPPGIIIQYPRSETKGEIPAFEDAPIFGQTLKEAHAWSKITQADSVARINDYVSEEKIVDFINLCEAKHSRMLVELGQAIEDQKDNLRLICIAGPSSSGKTTFANRLRIELMSRGFQPIRISIDDYYLPREEAPKDRDGKPDLENIHALNLPLFNQHLAQLINGEVVELPQSKFDAAGGHARTLKIQEDTLIIIEGIHALNDMLTSLVPKTQKYKIYISPQAQINYDDHNPMSLTDLRLLRRMVRDKKYRGSSAEQTIDMWPSVRRGEFTWIYKTQEEADYVFNSFLPYELCVMKRYAIPLLSSIEKESRYFPTAERLIRMLKYFVDMEEKWIPSHSLIREFIGGSCFREVED
ncbi:MAG: nucleoside kinase [Bacilli bacterium]